MDNTEFWNRINEWGPMVEALCNVHIYREGYESLWTRVEKAKQDIAEGA